MIASDFSDIEIKPYNLDFQLSKSELGELNHAFELMKDFDNKISFFELMHSLELKCGEEKIKETLMYGILKRIELFDEVKGDKRIDFETFKNLLLKAMTLQNTKEQASLMFNIFDQERSGFIHAYNIADVSR